MSSKDIDTEVSIDVLRAAVDGYDRLKEERDELRQSIVKIADAMGFSSYAVPREYHGLGGGSYHGMVRIIIEMLKDAKINAYDLGKARGERMEREARAAQPLPDGDPDAPF